MKGCINFSIAELEMIIWDNECGWELQSMWSPERAWDFCSFEMKMNEISLWG